MDYLGWAAGLGAAVYFFYSYNLLVRKHIDENKEMFSLIKKIHENTKKGDN